VGGRAAEVREARGDQAWDSSPDELKELFAAASQVVLAEIKGQAPSQPHEPPLLLLER